MSELNKIEEAIKMSDATNFQKLCDEYLIKKLRVEGIRGSLVSFGSEDGVDKPTKGTPDSFILTEDDQYILMEYTSQKRNLLNKVKSDLKKIKDSSIDKNRVCKIFFISATSNISIEQIHQLKEKWKQEKIEFEFVSNFDLAMDIRNKYRSLGKKYLGLELGPHQLITAEEFESEYDNQINGSKMNGYFAYRDTELKKLDQDLKDNDVIVITGSAGIGKTRLAFEYARKDAEHSYFIKNTYDIKSLFSEIQDALEDGSINLLVIDDANQIKNLQKIFQMFETKFNSRNIKTLITVRDYAKDGVVNRLRNSTNLKELKLNSLSPVQIRDCVQHIYNIKDDLVLDRINEVSFNNLRLALLSAQIYNKSHCIADIVNLDKIYNRIFENSLNKTKLDQNKLITLGIIAFLQHFDINNLNFYKSVLDEINMSESEFKENVRILYAQELIGWVDNKFVFIEDQTFANYILKIVFLDQKLISLSFMVNVFFEIMSDTVFDMIQRLQNIFPNEQNNEYIKQEMKKAFSYFEKKDQDVYLKFVSNFSEYDINKSILLVKNIIDQISPVGEKVNYELSNRGYFSDILLKIIGHISFVNGKYAAQLFYRYLVKCPQKFDQFCMAINQYWRITFDTFRIYEFKQQIALINELKNHISDEPVYQLLVTVIPEFLKINIEYAEEIPNDKSGITYKSFIGFKTEAYFKLRVIIWQLLISMTNSKLFIQEKFKSIIEEYIRNIYFRLGEQKDHIKGNGLHSLKEVIDFDKEYIVKIVKLVFKTTNLNDCKDIADLKKVLKIVNLSLPELDSFTENRDFQFYQQIFYLERNKGEGLDKYVQNYPDKLELFDRSVRLSEKSDNDFRITDLIRIVLSNMQNSSSMFFKAADIVFNSKTQVSYIDRQLISSLFSKVTPQKILNLIKSAPENKKDVLYFYFFSDIPVNKIDESIYKELKGWLKEETLEEINIYKNRNALFIYKFNFISKKAFENCCSIIWSKGKGFRDIYFQLSFISPEQCEDIVTSFEDLDLLENIYIFELNKSIQSRDYPGYMLMTIYKKDKTFLKKYLHEVLLRKLRNYTLREDEYELINLIGSDYGVEALNEFWNLIWNNENKGLSITYIRFLAKLLNSMSDGIQVNINKWLSSLIEIDYQNDEMRVVFEGLRYSDDLSILHKYIKQLILLKPGMTLFSTIPLHKGTYAYTPNEEGIKKVYGGEIRELRKLSDWVEEQGLDFLKYKDKIDECVEFREWNLKNELARLKAGMY